MRNYSRKFRKYRGGNWFGSSDPAKKLEEAKAEAKQANDKVTELETAIQNGTATEPSATDKASQAVSGTANKAKEALSSVTSMFSSKPEPPPEPAPQTGAGRRRSNRRSRNKKSKRNRHR